MRAAFTLLLLALMAFGPMLAHGEWRGTEARRVLIAQEMHHSGDWLVPTHGGEPTLAKPPLHYWVLAATMYFGDDRALLRLPSLLAMWGLALLAFRLLQRHFGELSAYFGAGGLLLSPMLLTHVPTAEIDPLFAALTGLSVLWLADGACFERRASVILGGVAGGLALLCKGPPYLLFLVGPLLVWGRRLRLRHVLWALPPMLLLPLVYYGPLLWTVDSSVFAQVAGEESVGRLAHFTFADLLELPGYLVGVVAMLFPMAWWTFHEYRGEREMRETTVANDEAFLRMCAGAMVGAALLLVLFPARPGRYLLPGVSLFNIGVAAAVASYARHGTGPSLTLVRVVHGLALLGSAGLIASPWLPFPFDERTALFCLALAVAPMWVRTRRQVAGFAMLVPLLASWTVYSDYMRRETVAPRSTSRVAEIVQRELRALGALDRVASRGHVPSELLLRFSPATLPRGDEFLARPATAPWLLVEDPDRVVSVDASVTEGYRDRVRIALKSKAVVIQERVR